MSNIIGRLGGSREGEEEEEEDSSGERRPDQEGAQWIRRRLAGSVVAVTTTVPGGYRGATLSACIFVSARPLLLLISLERDCQMDGWLSASGAFALNVLPWNEQFTADQFAGFAPRASATLTGTDHFLGETGCPVLRQSIAWADCRVVQILETGDHRCFIGEAMAIGAGSGDETDPLLYYISRYRRVRQG